jgi:predicted MFS family arabinose efflux permease
MEWLQLSQPGWSRWPALAPLSIRLYRWIWVAGFFSNLGTWIHEIGSQWLMTQLDPSPVMVASVRTAVALPVFLLALPAGVLADRWDRRRLLLVTQGLLATVAGVMAWLTWSERITPQWLLALTLLMGLGTALHIPTWQSLIPEIVGKECLPAAIGLGSVSFNLGRSVGPALAGVLISTYGSGIAFLLNAISFVGVLVVLVAWQRTGPALLPTRPNLTFMHSLGSGIGFVFADRTLRHCLILAAAYVLPASAIWSLLPLVVKEILKLEATGFGNLVGLFGIGAVGGAFLLPRLRDDLGSNRLVASHMLLSSAVLLAMGSIQTKAIFLLGLPWLGFAWMSILTTLQATAQMQLPNAVRARGMSIYLMTFSVSMALGSLAWGGLAQGIGISSTISVAGAAMLLTGLWSLQFQIVNLPKRKEI